MEKRLEELSNSGMSSAAKQNTFVIEMHTNTVDNQD